MSWVTGTATDYKDLLNKVRLIATGNGCTAVAINAGGTGYTAGDVLTVSGGTFSYAAKLRVTSVGSGIITGVVVEEGGAYTANPSNPVSVTGGTGSGATFNLTFVSNGWTQRVWNQQAVSATVAAGGTGWTTGQVATVSGGTRTTAATFTVTASAGVVTSVVLLAAGDYDVIPANPAATTGTGTGLTLTITWTDATGERTLILDGSGSGANNIIALFRTFQAAAIYSVNTTSLTNDTAYNWGVMAATSYVSTTIWYNQPGISPGFSTSTGALSTTGGCYVPLKTNDGVVIKFWISATSFRIHVIARLWDGGSVIRYANCSVGYHNRFGTAAEQPTPLYAAGTTSRYQSFWKDQFISRFSSIVHCCAAGTNGTALADGPTVFRDATNSVWRSVKNCKQTDVGSSVIVRDDTSLRLYTMYPCGRPSIANANLVSDTKQIAADVAPITGAFEQENARIYPTASGKRMLFPATIIASQSGVLEAVIGELDGVYWVSGVGLSAQDYIDQGDTRYRVFMAGQGTSPAAGMFCVREG